MKSKFISLEGIEGAGKSTVLQFCARYLSKTNIPHVITREPGGTPVGEVIREIILHPPSALDPYCELLLMTAQRVAHLQDIILPALHAGKWVLTDRFRDSTIAYQGAGRGIPLEKLTMLEAWIPEFRLPDHTLYLDLSFEQSVMRRQNRDSTDSFEQEDAVFFNRVRQAYHHLAQLDPKRFIIVDASLPESKVLHTVEQYLIQWMT